MTSAVEKCADFLENNHNYSNCHGSGLIIRLEDGASLSGQVSDIFTYDLLPNEWDSPKERLKNYLQNYWSIWSVYRTEEYKVTLLLLKEIPIESFREMTMGCIPIIKGKTKLLDCLYVVRQDHDTRFKSPELSQAFYHQGWYESYKAMESIVSTQLSKEENIELEEAIRYFRDGFSYNKVTNKRISAIIPVHIWGNAVWFDELVPLCKERNISIVEDATESLGTNYIDGNYSGKHPGTIGKVGCLSFNGNKIITSAGGGMILTNNNELAEKAHYLTTQAKNDPLNYFHDEVGFNYRLSNIHAAIGVAQLEQLPSFLSKKNNIYNSYITRCSYNNL